MSPTGSQIRAARALLGMSAEELAERARVSRRTIHNLETDARKPNRLTEDAVIGVLVDGGVEFDPPDPEKGRGVGVHLRLP